MKKKLLATLLVLCMILPSFGGLSALALDGIDMGDNATLMSDNPYNKIHFYFDNPDNATIDDATELQAATAAVKGDYAAALMAADGEGEVNENVYITVQFASDYMETNEYEVFKAALESATTPEMRDTVKTQRNTFSKRYHAAIIEENLPILAEIPYTAVRKIDYSSFVRLTVPALQLDMNVLSEVAENDQVLHLSVSNEVKFKATSLDTTTLEGIKAQTIVGNIMYTGEGITIGVYEPSEYNHPYLQNQPNYLDTEHDSLSALSNSIIADAADCDNGSYIVTHATTVVAVLAALVPDAQICYVRMDEDADHFADLSEFIEANCDIVNCSWGANESPFQYRYDIDAVFDQQIRTSGIVVTVASGNEDDTNLRWVTSPGYAYNAITVGGVDYSAEDNGWVHAADACYITDNNNSNTIIKPNISAPFTVDIPDIGIKCGTSISAPIVASCIAMLKEKSAGTSQYWMHPERISSALMATADRTADYISSAPHQFDKRVGAGILNLERLLGLSQYMYTAYTYNSTSTQNGFVVERTINMTQGQTIQLGLSWLASTNASAQAKNCTNYDLYIFDNTTGTGVAMSAGTDSSCELLRYTVTKTGTYLIAVKQRSDRNQADYIALTYNLGGS